ncbi:MAG: NADH-quinone oxidoreductase subunit NuoF [Acidaminococcales bacterium]|nr:NADH-quinone oxidoreductase subunit NuoF [Acidaminococcales bacterium]
MQFIRAHVLVCGGTGCMSSGSRQVQAGLEDEIARRGLDNEVKVVQTGCHGFCEMGPLMIIYPEGVFYVSVKAEDVPEIVETHLYKGRIIERLLYREPLSQKSIPSYDEINFYKKQRRIILSNCGHINPDEINEYIAAGGYEALGKALTLMTPAAVTEEVKKSGLRGRGGAGFPTGMKWQFARQSPGEKKYVVCNADEGDPGAFMDRSVLEGDPHRVIEGMIICGYAIGADEGYIYVRAEYPLAIKRLRTAIAQAEEMGFLGKDVFGSGFNFALHIKEGAGAFVCGEETALLQSIEGRRGMPRPRPPFPAVSGLWGKPTNINNVETFANIASIIVDGAEKYAEIGTEKSKGTKVFALTGKINNTGLAEVPMGITMREIIYDIGGGIVDGKKFKAVQIGGPSGGCLPEDMLDLTIDYDSLTAAGAMMGSGGLVVMDETTCMVDVAKFFLTFTQSESCGKCTPCREGTKRMLEILTRITNGEGREGDIALLEDLARGIKQTALCGLGQTAPNPVLSTLKYFRHEYEAHIKDHVCPAGACSNLTGYTITDDCRGCGMCKKVCPVGAIAGEIKERHVIKHKVCIKCGACEGKCPFKAIRKGA